MITLFIIDTQEGYKGMEKQFLNKDLLDSFVEGLRFASYGRYRLYLDRTQYLKHLKKKSLVSRDPVRLLNKI